MIIMRPWCHDRKKKKDITKPNALESAKYSLRNVQSQQNKIKILQSQMVIVVSTIAQTLSMKMILKDK